jgi:hypothetical protein
VQFYNSRNVELLDDGWRSYTGDEKWATAKAMETIQMATLYSETLDNGRLVVCWSILVEAGE